MTKPVNPAVVRRQNQLFDLHRAWVRRQVADGVPFHPEQWTAEKSEYNLHVLDVEASGDALDEFHTAARRLFK